MKWRSNKYLSGEIKVCSLLFASVSTLYFCYTTCIPPTSCYVLWGKTQADPLSTYWVVDAITLADGYMPHYQEHLHLTNTLSFFYRVNITLLSSGSAAVISKHLSGQALLLRTRLTDVIHVLSTALFKELTETLEINLYPF